MFFDSYTDHPGVIFDDCLTAEAASELTGYNIQHIRRGNTRDEVANGCMANGP
jgi:hypothetical protein